MAGQIAAMGDFLRAEVAAGRRYLPAGENVLRAFTQPFADVRVLIVGQDPYPTPGHPIGLSFAVERDVRPIPRSLANIYKELRDDLGVATPEHGDLTPWAQHGVLLLNRVLTVAPGASASHRGKGWEAVTEQAIRALVARDEPLVAILWGRDAQTLQSMLEARAERPVGAPQPAVGVERLLRLAAVQPRERAARRAGRGAGRLAAHLTPFTIRFPTRLVDFRAQNRPDGWGSGSAEGPARGKPPVAIGPHRLGVMRMRLLP